MADVTNYIDRLVAELCPDGVEYKPLGSFAQLVRGSGMPKTDFSESGVGAIHYGQIYTKFGTATAEVIAHVPEEKAKKLAVVNPGDVIVANTSENIEDVCKAVAWVGDSDIVTGGHATVIKAPEQNAKFISYYMATGQFNKDKRRHAFGTKVIDVAPKNLAKIEFPIPPLEIQEAIVEILDKFTNLEAELEAELEARTLQYEYYRDSLFETLKDPVNGLPVIANLVKELCPGGVKYSTLKSVSLKTTNIKWERSEESEYRYIDLSSVPTGGSSIGDTEIINSENAPSRARQIVHTDDILFGTTRPLLDRVVIVPEEYNQQICSTGYAVIRPDMNVIIPSYIYHLLRAQNFSAYVEKNQSGAAYPAISFKSVMEYMIPLPPLEIQQRIVDILDRFDALTTSLSEGLPAELAARRSQYEYYRDQLLSFPRKGENQ